MRKKIMANKKKQHYVPKCLLKQFSNTEGKVYLFRLMKNEVLEKPIPYKQQCYTNYMYGKDESWENLLAYYENSITVIIDKIIKNKTLSIEDEATLKNFILYQHLRTEKAIDINQYMLEQMSTKFISIIAKMENMQLNPYQISKLAKQYVQENNSRVDAATMNLELAKSHSNSLNDLKLLVLHSNNAFLCSDNPVVMDNIFLPENGLGIECIGIIFLMPISTQYAIILYDSKLYFHNKSENGIVIELSDDETSIFNKLSYINAREILFANNPQNLIDIKKYFDSKYIDKSLRNILSMFGIKDPILAGIEIVKLKKANISNINAIIPKFFAKKSDEKFPI